MLMFEGFNCLGSRRFQDLRRRYLYVFEDRELIRPPGALDVQRRNAPLVLERRMQRHKVIGPRKTLPPTPHPEAPRPDNFVALHPTLKDKWGVPALPNIGRPHV